MTHDDPLPDDDPDIAARAADAAVRRALVEGHRQILGFLRRRLGSGDEAEEVLQMFMLRAVERSADLRDVRSVRGWLSRILATTIVDHQRRASKRRKREEIVDPFDLEELSIEPDDELEEAICNCLYKLLPTLKPEYAEVIWRIDLLEEPRDRVAASLGVSLNNITVRLHRGRQALKKRLEEMCMTCPVHGFLDCRCDEAERWRRRRGQLGGCAKI
ncbi:MULTISPECIES: RNA polymerase sigma factor [Sphingomonadales]|uniref:RNA polymerase sigma factor n=1 Tax=Altererythrobacter sp. B11 TaxID=2060312 RepID=UPI000E5AA095|nr:RNA polymerase sigma factor [Altererythrobacter sp. B11]